MTAPADSAAAGGLFASLRRLAVGLLDTAWDRVALLSLEVQEEKIRLVRALVLAAWAAFAGIMTAACLTLAGLLLFWESSRLAAALAFAGLYGVATLGLALALRRHLRRMPRPFSGTLEELESDIQCLRPRS